MGATAIGRVVLIGISGSGKSTVARILAKRLGWETIDTDVEVEVEFGAPIPAVFAEHGEHAFRQAERRGLARALARDRVVVATGGGAVAEAAAWDAEILGRPGTLVVALDVRPETSVRRLVAQRAVEGDAVDRPLLAGADPVAALVALKARRQEAYDRAAVTLVVDAVPEEAVADEIMALFPHASTANDPPDVRLRTPSGESDIVVSPGSIDRLGLLTRERWPAARRVWLVTDGHVGPHHAKPAAAALERSGFNVRTHAVPPGEGSKSLLIAS